MGILLTFMFLWNMVGAMVLLPAMARFLMKEKHPATRKAVSTQSRHHLSAKGIS